MKPMYWIMICALMSLVASCQKGPQDTAATEHTDGPLPFKTPDPAPCDCAPKKKRLVIEDKSEPGEWIEAYVDRNSIEIDTPPRKIIARLTNVLPSANTLFITEAGSLTEGCKKKKELSQLGSASLSNILKRQLALSAGHYTLQVGKVEWDQETQNRLRAEAVKEGFPEGLVVKPIVAQVDSVNTRPAAFSHQLDGAMDTLEEELVIDSPIHLLNGQVCDLLSGDVELVFNFLHLNGKATLVPLSVMEAKAE